MSPAYFPLVIIPVAFAVQYTFASRYDWRCERCGETFSLSPLAATLLPHSFGGRKFARCPHCGVRSWVSPVPKQ